MIARRSVTIVAGALVLAIAATTRAHAGAAFLDLAGTWTGKITCKGNSEGVKDSFFLEPVMRISQSGFGLGVVLDYGGGVLERYTALVNPDAKKPDQKGELAIIFCGTDDQIGVPFDFDEIGRMSVSAKLGKVKASFKGTSIFTDFADPGPLQEGYTCKWKYTRTDTNPAGLQVECPAPIVGLPRARR